MAGVGKTALLRHAAATAVQHGWFSGGAFLIDLAAEKGAQPPASNAVFSPLLHTVAEYHAPTLAAAQDEVLTLQRLLQTLSDQQKRLLLVFDNVVSSSQIPPLLLGYPGHRVLIASRNRMSDLDGARLLQLDVLDRNAAVEMIAALLRRAYPADQRVATDPVEAGRLADLCGRLPLALRIAAAILADEHRRPLAGLTAELADAQQRLEGLEYGELTLRSALAVSYRGLTEKQKSLFRLLSLHPPGTISSEAACSLSAHSAAETRRTLSAVARASLLEASPDAMGAWGDHWSMHPLVRLFAREQLDAEHGLEARKHAVNRFLDYCVRMAAEADAALGGDCSASGSFATRATARSWLVAHRAMLIGATGLAEAADRPEDVSALMLSSWHFLNWGTHHSYFDTATVAGMPRRSPSVETDRARALELLGQNLALAGALQEAAYSHATAALLHARQSNRQGEARALNDLGTTYIALRDFASAVAPLYRAAALYRSLGLPSPAASTHTNLGLCLVETGRFNDAAVALEAGAQLSAISDDPAGRTRALTALGSVYRRQERLDEAVRALTEAVTLFPFHRRVDDHAAVLMNRGSVYGDLNQLEFAAGDLQGSAEFYCKINDLNGAARALTNLSRVQRKAGDVRLSIATNQRAVELFEADGDLHSAARAAMNLAIALRVEGEPAAALNAAQAAQNQFGACGDSKREAKSLLLIAELHSDAGNTSAAFSATAAAQALLDRNSGMSTEQLTVGETQFTIGP
jgi:tetratricopeptide (TPR) repeat protein